MFGIECHPMIPATFAHRILRNFFISGRVDFGDDIFVLQIYINPPGNRVVPGIAGLTAKVQSGDNLILAGIHHRFGAGALV